MNYGKVKNKLYNPIKQNKTHIYHVSTIIEENLPIISAVVFVQGNTQFINAENVYSLKGLGKLIKNNNRNLTREQMELTYEKLMKAMDKNTSMAEHIRNIHNMQNNLSNNICPRCGKQLIKRQGNKGDFMGCSGYPACRFTKSI